MLENGWDGEGLGHSVSGQNTLIEQSQTALNQLCSLVTCRRDKIFVFFDVKIVKNFANIYQI